MKEIEIPEKNGKPDIDHELLRYLIGITKLQAKKSEKGFNNDLEDVSEKFGVPARRVLSSVLDGDKEVIFDFYMMQERDVFLIFFKAAENLDLDKLESDVKKLHDMYSPEAGKDTKDLATEHGFFQGLLSSQIPFKYRLTYRMPFSLDYISIDYGGEVKHPPVLSNTWSAIVSLNPVIYLMLPDKERNQDYEVDGITGHELVIEHFGICTPNERDKPVFEWWGKVPSAAGEKELTLKIVSAFKSTKRYKENLNVWDCLLKNIKVEH
ncbi:hypothetical protein [Pseudodesulfovibrio sp.]|uniref:hypothetical protein n=1 Tax=unclassified Pseudodesulfovibrio TaxID=2661612 RepID=UPI003B000A90